MSDKNDDKKNENDPYDFFKLQLDNDDNDFDPKNNKPKKGFPFFGILLTVAAVLFVFNLLFSTGSNELIDFSEFRNLVEQGQIVRVELGDRYFTGYTADANANIEQQKKIGFLRPLNNPQPAGIYRTSGVLMQSFIQLLDEKGVEYKFIERQNNVLLQILVNIAVPVLLIFLVYFFIFKKMGGGMSGSMFGIGGGRSKAIDEGKVKTRFSDVAGVDEAKDELVEVVDFLKEPKKYTEIGGKIPKGVLLVGPPGTGKTLLARAVAGEAGVPFFRISGSDFVEMFVGVGASRVRDLFRSAREKAPCIIFIDEIDAIGKSRVSNFGGSNDEREQTLNQLLVEMDGFDNEKGLIILAATNRADVLDPALLRPGRFDRQVPVEKPDVKGREEILRIHAKNVKLDDSVDFESVAHGTTGFAGADLANVVNEAALLAVRNGHTKVTMSDMNDAIDKVSIGLKKKSRKDNEKDMRLVSIHETGHALVGAFTPDYPPVNKITVVPRSHGVGGFTQYREEEEKHFQTKKDILAEIDTLLGGRAAEEVVLGDVSTGASNDIARATEIVKHMIVDFGMSEKFRNMTLGKGVLGNAGGEPTLVREFSEDTQKYIDSEIARILNERYDYVLKLLTLHKELLENIAGVLKEKETIEGKEFLELVKAEKPVEVKAETKTARTRKTTGTKTTAAKKTSAKKAE
ncbi:MAG: ATP-dependent zinc metalloprotease FtsH [Treponema sp.]|nr:ATP-dependent zinc metalloprotease FtsH [Spirochaetia bacterium]MDY5811729.1 ATP-dependent zinc metalloprotease FtsH [Treponema sp.]